MRISLCIPHYNRARHLLVVLDSIRKQDHPDVEVVISDDCSTDDSEAQVQAYIRGIPGDSKVAFRYLRQPVNLGYDANLRAALGAATGEYLVILGNDDALSDATAVSRVVKALRSLGEPDAAFTNFHVYGEPENVATRAPTTRSLGKGPDTAIACFRSFSFVGGVVFRREAFERHDTPVHDGSVYFQIYLAARIAAAGGTIAAIAETVVAKDVRVDGKRGNSSVDLLARDNDRLVPRTGGLDQVGKVAVDAILPCVDPGVRSRVAFAIYRQLYRYTYPVWLLAYRRYGVYRASVNLALGCTPTRLLGGTHLDAWSKVKVHLLYAGSTLGGLVLPMGVLESAKRVMQQAALRARS